MRIEANGGCGCFIIILILLGIESLLSRVIYFPFPTLILYIILVLVVIKFIRWLLK